VVTYVLAALSVASAAQLVLIAWLLKRRRDLDLTRIEQRLTHFGEALALLTDTAQTGFASVASELERAGGRRAPAVSRAAASRRILGAAKQGRSVQDIAASEDVSESEIRLHLGLAEDLEAELPKMPAIRASRSARGRSTVNIGA
jgi:hypothetical protein